MALIVEDGTGLADAESFASVAESDAYATLVGNSTWVALGDSTKEDRLRLGCRYLEEVYSTRFIGYRTNETQALSYPREDVEDRDGYEIGNNEIPTDLKYANIEAAFRADEDLTPDIETTDSSGATERSIKVGPIEIHKVFGSPQSIVKRFPTIERLLKRRGLITGTSEVVRG